MDISVIMGELNHAHIYQTDVDPKLKSQVENMLKNPVLQNTSIELMPDAHPGKFFPIGLYLRGDIKNGIMPSLLGNDAGCGTTIYQIEKPKKGFNFDKLDTIIRENIPTGRNNRKSADNIEEIAKQMNIDFYLNMFGLIKADFNEDTAMRALGTLGSGNHYIEIDKDQDNNYYLIIHSGSRYLGNTVLEYWLDQALKRKDPNDNKYVYELGVLKDKDDIDKYLKDIHVCRLFAIINREIMRYIILKEAKIKHIGMGSNFTHNHIMVDNTDKYILYKGAIPYDPELDDEILVGTNPAEGHILVNIEENNDIGALPHGSGRALSRSDVDNSHTVSEFKKDMKNIHCTTICKDNLDECPKAYRSRQYLLDAIEGYDLGRVTKILEPVYVYKPME